MHWHKSKWLPASFINVLAGRYTADFVIAVRGGLRVLWAGE
jgi:hypothetical protein